MEFDSRVLFQRLKQSLRVVAVLRPDLPVLFRSQADRTCISRRSLLVSVEGMTLRRPGRQSIL